MTDLRARAAQANEPAVEAAKAIEDFRTETGLRGPVPDVADSGIEASLDVAVSVAWSRVMGEVQFVRKGSRREDFGGKYNFRGIDEVLNAVGPALRKHGVTVAQTEVVPAYDVVMTGNNKAMQRCRVTVTYAIVGPRGDVYPVPLSSVGEAFDAGDKSTPKAVSVALRSFYINNLAIPTDQPAMDPEHGTQYEIATPPPPTVDDYYREITGEHVTVTRLRAIRGELGALPAIAQAMVDTGTGEQISLLKLLTRIGAEKAANQ
jgi:hypothetical protein